MQAMRYDMGRSVLDVNDVMERASYLKGMSDTTDRQRIRAVMNGGAQGVQAVLNSASMSSSLPSGFGVDLPTANIMYSSLERLAQRIGRQPTIKTDMIPTKDTNPARKKAEKRARIVSAWDENDSMELQYPQIGRWLPGYGFTLHVIRDRWFGDTTYPVAELRDPYDVYPGTFGANQQPTECVVYRSMSPRSIMRIYPNHASEMQSNMDMKEAAIRSSQTTFGAAAGQWERGLAASGASEDMTVVEYMCDSGTYVVCVDMGMMLSFIPNPLMSGPAFVVTKRFAFDKLQGQFHHVFGLMAMMAKLNILGLIGVEDSTFREALALDTPIPTPDGWTTMGAIEKGDVIFGADGLPAEVIEATDVQHDRRTYRVTFADGTHIDASDGHLWEVRLASTRQSHRIYTTQEMVNDGRTFRVPKAQPWKLPEADLPIDPYLLGVWLGDGSSKQAIIHGAPDDLAEIATHIGNEQRTTEHRTANALHLKGLWTHLKAEGLWGNKHIPAAYLRGSIDQRTALLQGLVDTDGCISKKGYCSLSTNEKHLADQYMELLRTLGEVPGLYRRTDERSRTGEMFEVTWTARNVMPARLQRKADRVKMGGPRTDWVTITDITEIESVPVRCIAVASNDRLFLAGVGGHVTHNTNIIGEMVGNTYKRGRFAINEFEPGTRIEKPTSDQLQQTWQAINILERQFRIVAGYDVAQDGQSPNSFATGQGIKELGSSADQNVREYQTSIRYTVELLDRKRLEWEETMHGSEKKQVFWFEGAKHSEETYVPSKDIAGDYRTKRIFGAMATFDENSKIIAGLQMLQARVMDRRTLQENLDGLENVSLINERIDQDQAKEMLLQSLGQRAAQGDPTADMALVEILNNPSAAVETLKKLFTPQEPQMSPEEQAMAAGQGQPGMPGMPPGGPGGPAGGPGGGDPLEGGPPPAVQTILAQMESQGGGAMSVGRT